MSPKFESSGWELDLTCDPPKTVFFELYYSWRIYHPDGLAIEDLFPLHLLPPLIDGDDWEIDPDGFKEYRESGTLAYPKGSYFVATPSDSRPSLSQFWYEAGFLVEPLGQKERVR